LLISAQSNIYWYDDVINQHFKIQTIKRTFWLPLLAIAISSSVVTCKGTKSGRVTDSTGDSVKIGSSVKNKTDTSVKTDTTKMLPDTAKVKKDTVSKTTTKTTVSKKTEIIKRP